MEAIRHRSCSTALLSLAAAASLWVAGSARAQFVQPQFLTPPAKTYGAPDFVATMQAGISQIVVTATGAVLPGGPNALAAALRLAQPGDVISLVGDFPELLLGETNINLAGAVTWAGGAVIRDIVITTDASAGAKASIGGVTIQGNYTRPGLRGVDDILFDDVTITNAFESRQPVIVFNGSFHGMLRFYGVDFQTVHPGSWNGYGMKWNVRGDGRASYDFRNCVFAAAQEHCLYIDSPGSDGAYPVSVFEGLAQAPGTTTGRTGIQIVNRANSGPSGKGSLLMRDLYLNNSGGEGGSAITVVGHLGLVWIEDVTIDTDNGGIVFWTDVSSGVHLNANGFSTGQVVMRDVTINSPNADRDHIKLSGIESVSIYAPFLVTGNKTAFAFFHPSDGPIDNGDVKFFVGGQPLSLYSGFQAASKVTYQGIVLPDAVIDLFGF